MIFLQILLFIVIFFTILNFIDGNSHITYAYKIKKYYKIPLWKTFITSYFIKPYFMDLSASCKTVNIASIESKCLNYLLKNDDCFQQFSIEFVDEYTKIIINGGIYQDDKFNIRFYNNLAPMNYTNYVLLPVRTIQLLEQCIEKYKEEITASHFLARKKQSYNF